VSDEPLLAWCVVANVGSAVVEETSDSTAPGPGGGTKHFSGGTKVWLLPPQWGDGGEDVFVLGRHRGEPGGLLRMVIPRRQLTDFRTKPVYIPTLMAQLERPWRDGQVRAHVWSSKEEADRVAQLWSAQAVVEA
jgi:hypothetical protein